jgi:uncharacterized RDD family membrane protein YckC
MDLVSANKMLGTDAETPLAERQAAYQRQKRALENHLAQAQVPVLQDHFKRALALLDEAYAEIEIAAAAGDLPVLRALAASAPAAGEAAPTAAEAAAAETPPAAKDAAANGANGHAGNGSLSTLVNAAMPAEGPAALHASGPRSTIGGARIIDEDTFDLAPQQKDLDNIDLDNPNHETERTVRAQAIADAPLPGENGEARPATRRIVATSPTAPSRAATDRVNGPPPAQPATERIIAKAPPAAGPRPGTNRLIAPAPDEAAGNPGTRTVHRALVDALLARADATEDPKLRHALLSEACNAALVAADSPKTPAGGNPAVSEPKPGSSRVGRGAPPAPDAAAALERLRSSDPEIHLALTAARDAIARASLPTAPMPVAREPVSPASREAALRSGLPTMDMPAIGDEVERASMPTMEMPAIRDEVARSSMPTMPLPAIREVDAAALEVPGEGGLASQIAGARSAARRSLASTVPMTAISADLMPEDEPVAVAIAPASHADSQAGPAPAAPTDRRATAATAKPATEPRLAFAGFIARLAADLLDAGIVLPLMVLLAFCAVHSRHATALVAYALPFLALIYFVYLGWRFDGTPGKLVMGLRLRTPAGRPIGLFAGTLRAVPEVAFATVLCFGLLSAAGEIPNNDWLGMDVFARWTALGDHLPDWFTPMAALLAVWIVSEPLVLLTNRQRCALQDFLAETVVVQEELDPVAAARLAAAARS